MPSITLFNRRTLFGGDDLLITALFNIAIRCFHLFCFVGVSWWHIGVEASKSGGLLNYLLFGAPTSLDQIDDAECRHTHTFPLIVFSFTLGSTLFYPFAIFVESRIYHWSGKGCPTQAQPRSKNIEALLELKLLPLSIVVLLLFWLGVSALCFVPSYYTCRDVSDETIEVEETFWNTIIPKSHVLWLVCLALLVISQCFDAFTSLGFVLDLWIRNPHELKEHARLDRAILDHHNHDFAEEMWASRCSCFCKCLGRSTCFVFGGRDFSLLGSSVNSKFGDIARALADYLETRGVLDVVPSDILTGFLVLQRVQRYRLLAKRKTILRQSSAKLSSFRSNQTSSSSSILSSFFTPHQEESASPVALISHTAILDEVEITSNFQKKNIHKEEEEELLITRFGTVLDPYNPDEMAILHEGAHFSRFALAIYTWPLYLYQNPITGIPRIMASTCGLCSCKGHQNGSCGGTYDSQIIGDNICKAHKAAMLLTVGIDKCDLVYAHLKSGFNDNQYCIFVDHNWKSVVVAIRGTFCLEDCVTDVLCDPQSLEKLGEKFGFDASDQYCHGGVLACVWNVYLDLQKHNILDKLMLNDDAMYRDYDLRLTGHSLGGSICTILSYMLKPKFPSLRCINLSPPGMSLTWDLATQCKEWCTTFVLDSDVVPRLSKEAIWKMRDEMLDLIGRVKVPKYVVAEKFLKTSGLCSPDVTTVEALQDREVILQSIEEILYDKDEVLTTEYQEQLQRFQEIQSERISFRGNLGLRVIQLYPPGRIIHLIKTGERNSCMIKMAKVLTCCTTNAGHQYSPTWINNDALNEIIIAPTMGTDHFPNRIKDELVGVAEDFGLSNLTHPYRPSLSMLQ